MVTVRAALETLYCDRMSLSRAVPEPREDGTVFGPGGIPPGGDPLPSVLYRGISGAVQARTSAPGERHGLWRRPNAVWRPETC